MTKPPRHPDVEKRCVVCGHAFMVPWYRGASAKTCSRSCHGELTARQYTASRATLNCKACGKHFFAPASHAHRRIYCSRKCSNGSYKYSPSGEDHYAWNGGEATHSGGYLYIRVKGHPFCKNEGYVFEHRIVVETRMRSEVPTHPFLVEIDGQLYLSPKIDVHHIDNIKRNNRPSNLLACTPMAHRAIHNGDAPMQGETWPEIEGAAPYEPRRVECKCLVCGLSFTKKRSDVKRGSGKHYCSRTCFDKRIKKSFSIEFKQGERK